MTSDPTPDKAAPGPEPGPDLLAEGQLDLSVLPRRRMRRTLWRRIAVMVCVQLGVTLVILAALQGPWRRDHRRDHGGLVARLAADQLTGQFLHGRNTALQQIMDRMTAAPRVAYAVLLDPGDQVVMTSPPDLSPDAMPTTWPPVVTAAGTSTATHVDAISNLVLFEAPVVNRVDGASFRLIVGLDDLGAQRAALDGAIAAMGGFLVVLVGLLPLMQRRFHRWTRGLHDLHASVRRLASDLPPKPVPVTGADEIAYLTLAFNEMAGQLSQSHRALLEANVDLEERVALRTEELHAANTELEQKNQKLSELTETAMRFTDDVAHEFRTPLTVAREFASILADGIGGEVTDGQAEYLQFIINATGDLAQLVDDFLDSGKLRAGTLRVDRRSVSVDEVLDSVWPILESRAATRSVRLERSVEPGLPSVFADVNKAGRALINLVTNAVKFSPNDEVVRVSADLDAQGSIVVSVRDRGPGMPPAEVATLFERFRQGGEGHRSASKGFGLGLNIVRDLVAINLGAMSVESAVGKGSMFAFTLPADDASSIVRAHLQRAVERDEAATISVLRFAAGADPGARDALREFLGAICYSTDLLLPVPDGTLLAIGATDTPHLWRRKLHEAHADSQCHGDGDPLEPECLGTWPVGEASAPILACCRSAVCLAPAGARAEPTTDA